MAWTRRAADRELGFAETLVLRMPAVFAALETGRIDRNKAWVFADLCTDLTPEQTEVVCTRLLPHAQRLTTGELAARIKKLAIALDPEWAARRYASAVRERNVIGYLDPDGTATLTGTGLPVEQAAAACARVEELARPPNAPGTRAGSVRCARISTWACWMGAGNTTPATRSSPTSSPAPPTTPAPPPAPPTTPIMALTPTTRPHTTPRPAHRQGRYRGRHCPGPPE